VGSAAQKKAMKQVAGRIKLELAQYREMAAFSQFSSDLDVATQKLLNRGERLTELLKQQQYSPLSLEEQVISLFAGVRGYLDTIPVKDILAFEEEYLDVLRLNQPEIFEDIRTTGTLSEESEEKLAKFLTSFCASFTTR
jgi:F-type H+-transporting ATPase subunit alpha